MTGSSLWWQLSPDSSCKMSHSGDSDSLLINTLMTIILLSHVMPSSPHPWQSPLSHWSMDMHFDYQSSIEALILTPNIPNWSEKYRYILFINQTSSIYGLINQSCHFSWSHGWVQHTKTQKGITNIHNSSLYNIYKSQCILKHEIIHQNDN